jgi:FSR family fosmidomycin resistance protein-like MFS transporter
MTSADLSQGHDATAASVQWKPVGLLSVSHALVDLCQGMVPALLPFLVSDLRLSYAAGAGLVFATSSASSIVQPFFGYLADRSPYRWLLPVSLVLTGAGLAFGSQSAHYAVFFLALMVSGLGVAAFHPEAARQVHRVARPGRTAEMSVFAVGGNLGFALAPVVTTALLLGIGRGGILTILLPTGVIAVLLALQFSTPKIAVPSAVKEAQHSERTVSWPGFLTLCAITICRSILFVGLNTFLALYWMSHWAATPSEGATILALFLGVGITGTLLGGWLADRWGRRTMLRCGFGMATILLPLLLTMTGTTSATVMLVFLAVAFYMPSSILVVLGQAYLPHRVGVASGVTLGLGVSVGGMVAPLLGMVADSYSVEAVLLVLEAILVIAVVLSLTLPPAHRPLPGVPSDTEDEDRDNCSAAVVEAKQRTSV